MTKADWEHAKYMVRREGGELKDYLFTLDEADEVQMSKVQTLLAYARRVGAKPRSFRKFVVFDTDAPKYGKMSRARDAIAVAADGTLKILRGIEPPSDAEAVAIKAEVANAGWPTSVGIGQRSAPSQLSGVEAENIFRFLSRDGTQVHFIQHRKELEDGKVYIPWSYWSDGVWRQMEPDGLLPLYGLQNLRHCFRVFLHEGAKAARVLQLMSDAKTYDQKDALARHPWGAVISGAAHIGWIGGATNAHRTDWSPLREPSRHQELIVVADNDAVGKNAVSSISRQVKRSMSVVIFDDRFPSGFDMADPWPRHKDWTNEKHYTGPTLHDLSHPATWATEPVQSSLRSKGRPKFRIRPEFAEEWCFSQSPYAIVHREQCHRLLTPDAFNRTVRPFSDVDTTDRLLVQMVSVQASGIAYRPHRERRAGLVQNIDGSRLINTFRPSAIQPLNGDVEPFLEFMTHLIPDESDRAHVVRWCATLISNPEIKIRFALLLISENQGVGKTTLGASILAPLVGLWNVSTPSEHHVTDSDFNSWAAHKRLVMINEIYSGHSRRAYDRLKSFITDDTIEVNRKFLEPYTIENWVHVFACSNSERALHLDDVDRRWLVPRVTEETKSQDWWTIFHAWLKGGGLSIIANWADEYVKQNGTIATGEHAPPSSTKAEVVAASRSEGARLAHDLAIDVLESARGTQEKIVLRIDEVRSWVAAQRHLFPNDQRLESASTLRKAMISAGLLDPKRAGSEKTRLKIDRKREYVVANFEIDPNATWADLKEYARKPEDFPSI